jgi:Rieske Fe-S protein
MNSNGAPKRVPLTQWSKDFPIEVGEDNYVARRDFTKFMVLTSFAFAVGQLWIGAMNVVRRSAGKPPLTPIARLSDLAVGGSTQFAYPGENDPCVLVRLDETRVVAYSQKCTHLSCAIIPETKAGCFRCPCHEGSFDLASGKPLAGPPRRPLPRIMLEIKGDQIYAAGVEVSTT